MEVGTSLRSAPSYAGAWTRLVGKSRQGGPLLEPWLENHLTSTLGFSQMTPVQASTIPQFLSHRDVIVEAVTGSGKTLAYVVPILQMLIRRYTSMFVVNDGDIDEKDDQERRRRRRGRSYKKGQVGALVICPTRELAQQVHGVVSDFLSLQPGARSCNEADEERPNGEVQREGEEEQEEPMISGALLVIGGTKSSPAHDYKKFKDEGADIIVGTPGRVQELLDRPSVDVKELEVLVLDEADRLLDLGFAPQITSILQMLPKQRRTGLFSATMNDGLTELARVGLRNPVRVVVKVESRNVATSKGESQDKRMPASLQSFYLVTRAQDKLAQLLRLLVREASGFEDVEHPPMRKAIVYFATCAQVNYFYKILTRIQEEDQNGCVLPPSLRLYSLHGKQTPSRRTATFESFVNANPIGAASLSPSSSSNLATMGAQQESAAILFCTDVAARGLDLPDVDLVVQFDPPTDPKSFSHRCGRTARAGRHGKAVVLLSAGREEEYVAFLKVRKCPVRLHSALLEDGTEQQQQESKSGQKDEAEQEREDVGATRLTERLKKAIAADRDLYDWSMRAFVSFVRSYGKHEASFIFRPQDLDFVQLARAFGLLRLPRMPETRGLVDERNQGEEAVDLTKLAYKDEKREKQRLASMEIEAGKARKDQQQRSEQGEQGEQGELTRKKKMRGAKASEEAWSDQKKRKERREERKEKKTKRRKAIRAANAAASEGAEAQAMNAGEDARLASDAQVVDEKDDKEEDDWIEEERATKRQRKQVEGHFADVDFEGL